MANYFSNLFKTINPFIPEAQQAPNGGGGGGREIKKLYKITLKSTCFD